MESNSLVLLTRLLSTTAFVEERFSGSLSSVHGLSLREVMLLLHVQSSPGARLTRIDLAKRMHVSASTTTRMIKPLEKLGIVERQQGVRDARLAYVAVTKAGEKLLTNAKTTLDQLAQELFEDRWKGDEISTLTELLGRISIAQPLRISS